MLGCTEGAGMSPEVPRWPCLAYFKWCNLYFAELQRSIAQETLRQVWHQLPKALPGYMRVCVCVLWIPLCWIPVCISTTRRTLSRPWTTQGVFGLSWPKQQLPQFSMSPGVHDCAAATAADVPAHAVTTNAFWQHQNQWRTAQRS